MFMKKVLLPYWREGIYDQLLSRIRGSLWKIRRLVNKSVNYWACQNVPGPKNTFFVRRGGGKYNSLNSTFNIGFKKGFDSEDADRRDSMTRLIFSSFCRADEKLYNKPIFVPCQMARPRKVFELTSPSLPWSFHVIYWHAYHCHGPSTYYINILITVMVLPRIILTSLSLSWPFHVLY